MKLSQVEIQERWNEVFEALRVEDESRKSEIEGCCKEVIAVYLDAIRREKSSPTMTEARSEALELARSKRKEAKIHRKRARPGDSLLASSSTDHRDAEQRRQSVVEAKEFAQAEEEKAVECERQAEELERQAALMERRGGDRHSVAHMAQGSPEHALVATALPVYESIRGRKAGRGNGPFAQFCIALRDIARDEQMSPGLERQIRDALDWRDRKPKS